MMLDDGQIERYSRQIVLREIGAEGQARLLAAHVAVVGEGPAAERALAYLAAAGTGRLTAPATLHHVVDPAHPDVRLDARESGPAPLDALVVVASGTRDPVATLDAASAGVPAPRHVFWIAGGRAAEVPPCPACVAGAWPALAPPPPTLRSMRDALLGTVVASEVVKTLVAVGTPLTGRVLQYDPVGASVEMTLFPARPACARCARG